MQFIGHIRDMFQLMIWKNVLYVNKVKQTQIYDAQICTTNHENNSQTKTSYPIS